MASNNRGTIYSEQATVLSQDCYPNEQFILRVHAPRTAAHALPGSFAHVQCGAGIPMRRPLSIMRVNNDDGWVEFLYKIVGQGLQALSQRVAGEELGVMGPIGKPFELSAEFSIPMLIGGGVGIPPMVFLSEHLKDLSNYNPMLFMGSEVPFPFELAEAGDAIDGILDGVDKNLKILKDWNIPGRLASLQGYSGVFEGYVTELASHWLTALSDAKRAKVEMFACGPTPMLNACAALARKFSLPAQLSLEEHMACAVGGCAGCTVMIDTPEGPAMKRVCVDGPVFNAEDIVAFRAAS